MLFAEKNEVLLLLYLSHGWILPHHDLVLGIPMSAYELIYVLTPGKITYLHEIL